MTSVYGPVTDWATDFDHVDPEYSKNIYEIWDTLKSSGCPIAHTERYGGTWLPLTYEMVHEIAYDTDRFSSVRPVVGQFKPSDQPMALPAPIGPVPPISSDPPFHTDARRLLLPAFSPKQIDPLRKVLEDYCNELIDNMGDKEYLEVSKEFTQNIPVMIICHMLGFPLSDIDKFLEWIHVVLESVNAPIGSRQDQMMALGEYIQCHIEDRKVNPGDDLITYLLNAEMYGEKLSDRHVHGTVLLALIAGIDTTWSAMGSSLLHLATNPVDRRRLVENPSMIPQAVEEFLRAYAPVTMARIVTEDTEFHGVQMKKEDWVLLPFPAANRDENEFEDPATVNIDREVNRHSAFGLGIHRCIGSNLARLEINVAVEVFLKRFPDFELNTDEEVRYSTGQVRGPRYLPFRVLRRG